MSKYTPVRLSESVEVVVKVMSVTAHSMRGHQRICSLGGVGYLGCVTAHLAGAQEQQRAPVYRNYWRI